jgi:hypothetical protein
LRGTRALRAAFRLGVTLFFLEGEWGLAQAPPEPIAPPPQSASDSRWHALVTYGQASAPRSQGFAEAATASLARDFPFSGAFRWGVEVTPLFVVNQTRVDLPGRPRETAYAAVAAPFLAFTWLPATARVGLRLEGGVGIFWGFSPIPAEGSRINFFDEFGGTILVRAGRGRVVSFGVRRAHVSNLGLAGPDNPGLSFYSGVAGLSWPAR